MKRLALFVFAAVLLAGCKQPIDLESPSIEWASNPSFAQQELGTGLDGTVTLTAPGKIESVSLTLGLGNYSLLANQYISISSNKSTSGKLPVFDVIDDSSVSSYLNKLGMTAGTGLRGKTVGTLDIVALMENLLNGQVIENNSNFSVELKLTDQGGKSVSKTAKFHYTAAPEISWTGNTNFDIVDLTNSGSKPSKVRINAAGKIEGLTVTLEYGGAPELATYVQNRTSDRGLVIDLINDEGVADAFKFPTAKSIQGKTEAVLDFSFMYDLAYDLSASTSVFTVKATDKNGKSTSAQLKFKK